MNNVYEHYKGNRYKVIGVAKHSETGENLVVYEAMYGDKGMWARPADMFYSKVVVDGVKVPRFKKV